MKCSRRPKRNLMPPRAARFAVQVNASVKRTRAAVTPPRTRAAVTTPRTRAAVTTPRTRAAVTPPRTRAAVTTPRTRAAVTTPRTRAAVTTPRTRAAVTTPRTRAAVTPPRTRAAATTPRTRAAVTTPRTKPRVSIRLSPQPGRTPKPKAQSARGYRWLSTRIRTVLASQLAALVKTGSSLTFGTKRKAESWWRFNDVPRLRRRDRRSRR